MSVSSKKDKDFVDLFHEKGIHIPTRTISLDSTYGEENEPDGVTHYMATQFLKNLHILESLNKDPVTIWLNTDGGSCIDGYAIYDAIKASKCHITVKVYGCAMSMGHTILQAADERVMTPNSSLMFHAGTVGSSSNQVWETYRSAEFDKRFMERLYKITLDRINERRDAIGQARMSKHKFKSMVVESAWFFADEAVEIGLADRIEE